MGSPTSTESVLRRFAPVIFISLTALSALAICPVQAESTLDYTVRPGDRLWTLSETYLDSPAHVAELIQLNQIRKPRQLRPGSVLKLPRRWLQADAAPIEVADIRGETQLRRSGETPREAQSGEPIMPGDLLETGPASGLTLRFFEGSSIHLRADSQLKIVRSESHADGRLTQISTHLLRGDAEIRVPPRTNPNRRFELISPAATTSVRGTRFRARVDAGGRLREEVIRGETQVANPLGSRALPAGLGIAVSPGEAPGKPVPLLPAPDLSDFPTRLEARHNQLRWPPLPGATQYRYQLSEDPEFTDLLRDERLPAAEISLDARTDRQLLLRIAGVDAQGLVGNYAQRKLTLAPPPEVPRLHFPQRSAKYLDSLTLGWSAISNAVAYTLQLAERGDFSQPLQQHRVSTPLARLEAGLAPGEFQWRVIAHTRDARNSVPSDTGTLQIVSEQAAAPEIFLLNKLVVSRWPALPAVRGYQLQLATDAHFNSVLSEAYSAQDPQPIASMPLPVAGHYFLRLRALYHGERTDPWSQHTEFDVHSYDYRWLMLWIPLSFAGI